MKFIEENEYADEASVPESWRLLRANARGLRRISSPRSRLNLPQGVMQTPRVCFSTSCLAEVDLCRQPAVIRAPHHQCARMEWPFPWGTGGERTMVSPHAVRITGQRNKGGNARSISSLRDGIFLYSGGPPSPGGRRASGSGTLVKRRRSVTAEALLPKRHCRSVTAEALLPKRRC